MIFTYTEPKVVTRGDSASTDNGNNMYVDSVSRIKEYSKVNSLSPNILAYDMDEADFPILMTPSHI